MENRRYWQVLLQHWREEGWLKNGGKKLWIGYLKIFMEQNKCKHCNCGCHCNVKEHGDMYGLCSCLTCEHDMEECEACQ